ncbi:MAG: hypothetical protein ACTSU5_00020 [Promethearchaeota archaeon]
MVSRRMDASISSELPGILLTDWDEKEGPMVIVESLPGIDEPAEILATQSYLSAQNVFSSVEFSRISFSLPNLKIRRKMKIYFDVVEDESVRGGRRPFMLAVYFPLETPDSFLERFDDVVHPYVEGYKDGVKPDAAKLQDDVARFYLSEYPKYLEAREKGGPEGTVAEEPVAVTSPEDSVILKIYCEICKREIPMEVAKSNPSSGGFFMTYTYLHGFGEEGLDPHGLKVTVGKDGTLTKVEYVDAEGHAVTPGSVRSRDLKDFRVKVGPWRPDEVKQLKDELGRGTPPHRIAVLLQRTIKDVEKKVGEVARAD